MVGLNHDLDLLSMATTPRGDLWFTGGNGIFRFSSAALGQNRGLEETPLDYAWFGRTDGMASTQCSIGPPNIAIARDGRVWVATVQGLAMLDLQHLPFNSAKPRICVDEGAACSAGSPPLQRSLTGFRPKSTGAPMRMLT